MSPRHHVTKQNAESAESKAVAAEGPAAEAEETNRSYWQNLHQYWKKTKESYGKLCEGFWEDPKKGVQAKKSTMDQILDANKKASYQEKVSFFLLTERNIDSVVGAFNAICVNHMIRTGENLNILEINAGKGMFARVMQMAFKTKIITGAFGEYIPTSLTTEHWKNVNTDIVEDIEASEAIKKHTTANCLVSVWPDWRGGDWCTQAVVAFREKAAKEKNLVYFMYIGEGEGGCCAMDSLFDEMENWEWFVDDTIDDIDNFPDVCDRIFILEYDARETAEKDRGIHYVGKIFNHE